MHNPSFKTEEPTSSRPKSLDDVVKENVRIVATIHDSFEQARSMADVVADGIASFCGSMVFVYVHVVWFGLWLLVNATSIFPKSVRFDPPPFQMLTLVVSLEAIFLSTFILISQNRQQLMADKRNHLDLQINLLAEQETSLILHSLSEIKQRLGIEAQPDSRQQVLEKETDVLRVVEKIDQVLQPQAKGNSGPEQ
jgi:uncharacterized membrane protein